jgi:hypothetical protein
MSKIKQPDIRPHSKGIYKLYEDYSYTHYKGGASGYVTLVIRSGFIYDGASVPRGLWSISGIRPDGLLRPAALVHDALYENKGIISGKIGHRSGYVFALKSLSMSAEAVRYTRKECDQLFLKVMKEAGVGLTDRTRAYWAVRLFGWIPWRRGL